LAKEAIVVGRARASVRPTVTPEIARQILSLGFGEEVMDRARALALKNQEGRISPKELAELDSYVKAGDLLAILQSKARKFLNGLH
jgi:hypothetical protein